MDWTDKLERKWGKLGIPNLINILLGGQLIVGLIALIAYSPILALLPLNRTAILQFQLWRLVSFLFFPTWIYGALGILSLLFYFWAGNALTRIWGDFKMTLYVAIGVLGAWAGCLLTGGGSEEGIFLSLFFAYAWLWPEQQVLFFGIIPLKVKWLGWFELAIWLLNFIRGSMTTRVSLVLGLAGFVAFFGREVVQWAKDTVINYKRRQDWNNRNK